MSLSDLQTFVQCTTCHSHVSIERLSVHECSLIQPHRFSQISYYNLELDQKEGSKIVKIKGGNRRFSNETYRSQCSRCHRDHATISFASKLYHKQCFTCFICRLPLNNTPYRSFEDQLYCIVHYDIIVEKPTCPACQKPIESYVRPTLALERLYHPEHIRCHHCHKSVDPFMTGIVERKGKIYCQTDFNQLYLPKCEACHVVIEKTQVTSKDGKLKGVWHRHCFKCQLCEESISNKEYYVHNNKPYCKADYYKLKDSLCSICKKPVEGLYGELSNGLKVHPACFTCHVCHCNINNVYFMYQNRVYCQIHKK